MKEIVLDKTINFLLKYQNYSTDDIEKLKYGLEGIYLTITKMIIIIALAIILGILKEVFYILILFNFLRYFGFGIHARKSSECLISSIICFIVLPYILLNINITNFSILMIGIVCIINFLLFAPADTIKRPLKNKKKRIFRKIATILLAAIYIVIALYIKNKSLASIFIISVIIEAIMVNPIMYKLLKQPFNNYNNV